MLLINRKFTFRIVGTPIKRAQHPSFIALCLNHEHSIWRHRQMIYLCGVIVIFKQKIIENCVFIRQLQHLVIHKFLRILAFPFWHFMPNKKYKHHKKYKGQYKEKIHRFDFMLQNVKITFKGSHKPPLNIILTYFYMDDVAKTYQLPSFSFRCM